MQHQLLTVSEAAEYLRISKGFLNNKRTYGGGPEYTRVGRKIMYRAKDLDAYLNRRTETCTSERSAA